MMENCSLCYIQLTLYFCTWRGGGSAWKNRPTHPSGDNGGMERRRRKQEVDWKRGEREGVSPPYHHLTLFSLPPATVKHDSSFCFNNPPSCLLRFCLRRLKKSAAAIDEKGCVYAFVLFPFLSGETRENFPRKLEQEFNYGSGEGSEKQITNCGMSKQMREMEVGPGISYQIANISPVFCLLRHAPNFPL